MLSYRSTWVIMWLWKVSSADAFLQFTSLAILFDKLWVSNLVVVITLTKFTPSVDRPSSGDLALTWFLLLISGLGADPKLLWAP